MGRGLAAARVFNQRRKDILMTTDSNKEILHAPAIITREGHSVGKSEEFKRPDHNDFLTSTELKKAKFSGVRHNSITDMQEIWILGRLEGSMAMSMVAAFPKKWEELYRDVFGLSSVTAGSR